MESQSSEVSQPSEKSFELLKTVYEVPKKLNMMEMIQKVADDNRQQLRRSLEIDRKMEKIQQIFKSLDETDRSAETNTWGIADSQSILSANKRVGGLEEDTILKQKTKVIKKEKPTKFSTARSKQSTSKDPTNTSKLKSKAKPPTLKPYRVPPTTPVVPTQKVVTRAKNQANDRAKNQVNDRAREQVKKTPERKQTTVKIPVVNLKLNKK